MVYTLKMGISWFKGFRIIHKDDLVLPGEHNLENILAAVLAALLAGISVRAIIESLTTFSGIEHRLQLYRN
ncbi:UDP-N-acetylmuramoylalanine--D-glutamate ligase [Staphylococcus gallinarum]|uniref:UDP-N-acetylmuramoylalanine--D-glutamate ligase n=1 Tax=Staphylococcus gallinarum TaxID=1293 RepID=A0A380FEF2_STAGA|nr:UDP-N-acetylmuramoylalanine--D-glutamate ligase [Staphylococcus gallinarum]